MSELKTKPMSEVIESIEKRRSKIIKKKELINEVTKPLLFIHIGYCGDYEKKDRFKDPIRKHSNK